MENSRQDDGLNGLSLISSDAAWQGNVLWKARFIELLIH